jgi:hypothetical protein
VRADPGTEAQWARVAKHLGLAPAHVQSIATDQPLNGSVEGISLVATVDYEVTRAGSALLGTSGNGFFYPRLTAVFPRSLDLGLVASAAGWRATQHAAAERVFHHRHGDGTTASDRLRMMLSRPTTRRLDFTGGDASLRLGLRPTFGGVFAGEHTLDHGAIHSYGQELGRIARALVDANAAVGVDATFRDLAPAWKLVAEARGLDGSFDELAMRGSIRGLGVECRAELSRDETTVVVESEGDGVEPGGHRLSEEAASLIAKLLRVDVGWLPPRITIPEEMRGKGGTRSLSITSNSLRLTGNGVAPAEALGEAVDQLVALGCSLYGAVAKSPYRD